MYDKQYLYLLEVARTGSIAKAAKKFYISPSTLSKAIQKKEDEIGSLLFDRVGKTFIPTAIGEQFLDKARRIVDLQLQLDAEMKDIINAQTSTLRVGRQLDGLYRSLVALTKFHQQYPMVNIQVYEDTGPALSEMLENGEIDLMLVNPMKAPPDNWHITVLQSNELILLVPEGHRLTKKTVRVEGRKYPLIQFRGCVDESFILPFSGQAVRAEAERLFASRGYTLHVPICATSLGSILKLVSMGNGITLTYDSDVADELDKLHLAILGFQEMELRRSFAVIHRTDRYLSSATKQFEKICMEEFYS